MPKATGIIINFGKDLQSLMFIDRKLAYKFFYWNKRKKFFNLLFFYVKLFDFVSNFFMSFDGMILNLLFVIMIYYDFFLFCRFVYMNLIFFVLYVSLALN